MKQQQLEQKKKYFKIEEKNLFSMPSSPFVFDNDNCHSEKSSISTLDISLEGAEMRLMWIEGTNKLIFRLYTF